MRLSWAGLTEAFDRLVPEGSPRRKLLTIVAIVLLFEGVSVVALFSYFGAPLGLLSIAFGILLLMLLNPSKGMRIWTDSSQTKSPSLRTAPGEDPPGMRFVDAIMNRIGNDYLVMAIGAAIIILVVVYNRLVSARPDFGDMDTLSMMFGGMTMVYPFLREKFKVEATFSLLFLGLVVVILVIPQAITSSHKTTGLSIGNWYVEYMLAGPFAGMLNLVGIPASSAQSMVTLQFADGSTHTLSISAYCAGLYSFSIFLAAFFSFVLVFERLRPKMLVLILCLGLAVAFLGNLFRMVIIGVIGYYRGLDALLWAHANVGWILFLSWSAVFWYLLLGYVSRHSESAEDVREG
jgi:archaeosortase C (PEF-CTERM variant)